MADKGSKVINFLAKAFTRPVKLTDGSESFFTFAPNWNSISETTTISGQAWAYNNCPPVNSIINRKVRAFTNGRWVIRNEKGDVVKRTEARGTVKSLYQLFDKPNPLQTWPEFIAQAKVYEQVFGQVFIFPVYFKPLGIESTASLWVIPNWLITPKMTGRVFLQSKIENIIEGYQVGFTGDGKLIPPEEILRLRDVSVPVTEDYNRMLDGQSRLYAMGKPVSNILAAYEARNVLITRRGAIGILSNDGKDVGGTIPLKPKEKQELQDDFRQYGLSAEQFQVIITNAAMKWQTMTFPTKELMLFEEIEDDTRQLCDAYDYPMPLLGFAKGTTFSNLGEAKKTLYEDTIKPESLPWCRAFASFFQLPEGYEIFISFEHLEIYQRSRKEIADAVRLLNQGMVTAYQNRIITLEEWRKILSNTLLHGELNPEVFFGSTFFVGQTPEVTPGNQVHAEQPKPRT